MNEPRSDRLKSLEVLAADIRNLHNPIEYLIQRFCRAIAKEKEAQGLSLTRQSGAFWKHVAYADSLVRLKLFVEQNFNYIESMGLLSVTRYLFELMLWLKLLEKDIRYGMVYYHELLVKQLSYYRDLYGHLGREIGFLREIGEQEDRLLKERLKETEGIADPGVRNQALLNLGGNVMKEIDGIAARRFNLYGEQARTNGYSFQAYLVETKILPSIVKSLTDIEQELNLFERTVPADTKSLMQKRWSWKHQATIVGMENEYDFIYSYTSRLLHATPASLTTDHKNLEPDEMWIFLKYFHIRLLDVIEMADRLLNVGAISQ